jgi:hypothetical protein
MARRIILIYTYINLLGVILWAQLLLQFLTYFDIFGVILKNSLWSCEYLKMSLMYGKGFTPVALKVAMLFLWQIVFVYILTIYAIQVTCNQLVINDILDIAQFWATNTLVRLSVVK